MTIVAYISFLGLFTGIFAHLLFTRFAWRSKMFVRKGLILGLISGLLLLCWSAYTFNIAFGFSAFIFFILLWNCYLIFFINLLNSVQLSVLLKINSSQQYEFSRLTLENWIPLDENLKNRIVEMELNGLICRDGLTGDRYQVTWRGKIIGKVVIFTRRLMNIKVLG